MNTINVVQGNAMAAAVLWEKLLAADLPGQAPGIQAVYFFAQRCDYVIVDEKTSGYFQALVASHKELIWFKNSAHSPNSEDHRFFSL